MLQLDRLSVKLSGRWLLDGITLEVQPGQTVLVTGPNGAGKSVLAQAAVGLLAPQAGRVTVDGVPVTRRKVRRQLGYLPQAAGLYPFMTAMENLHFHAAAAGLSWRRRRSACADVLELVGLTEEEDVEVGRLTPGQLRRLAIARALVSEPRILVVDEPLACLDAHGRQEMLSVFREFAAMGKAVLAITGDPAGWTHDRLFELKDGRLQGGEAA